MKLLFLHLCKSDRKFFRSFFKFYSCFECCDASCIFTKKCFFFVSIVFIQGLNKSFQPSNASIIWSTGFTPSVPSSFWNTSCGTKVPPHKYAFLSSLSILVGTHPKVLFVLHQMLYVLHSMLYRQMHHQMVLPKARI